MKHAEVVIARRAVEEGRGLVVVVNKMDLLKGKQNSKIYERVIEAVPEEIQTVIPQVCQYRVEKMIKHLPSKVASFHLSRYYLCTLDSSFAFIRNDG